jgi:hypothetical protein
MFTQESSYSYTLMAAVVAAMVATVGLLFWALHGFQVFW